MYLLHIEASPRGQRSRSTQVAQALIDALPNSTVETLKLFDAELPAFDAATIEGRYDLIAGQPVAPAIAAGWSAIQALTDHFLSFDGWIISTPMWNFGIPYKLKHYIDLITQPGMSFSVHPEHGVVGHAQGKTAILIGSGALNIQPGSELANLDHQIAFLETWLRFIGVTDIRRIDVRPTYGPIDETEATVAGAIANARKVAASFKHAI